ncbi:MAG: lipid II flippase MurJ [Candidatus Acidiferrales bacterium]
MRPAYETARAAIALTILSLLSPVAGMAVEMALAWRYGTSSIADAYRIGSMLLLMGQQLLVLQILPHVLVPVFTDCRARRGAAEAWRVAQGIGNVFLLGAGLFGAAQFLWPKAVVWLLAGGLAGPGRAEALAFVRWIGLAYAPLVVTGVATALLYTQRIFWLPSVAQLARNLLLAAIVVVAARATSGPLIFATIVSVAVGSALTLGRLVPLVRKDRARASFAFGLRDPDVRRGLALSIPLLGMFLAGIWSPLVINRVLSGLPTGSLAVFGYAFKLGLLISLAPLTLATVLFPRFADERSTGAPADLETLGTRGLRMGLFLAAPTAAWALALRRPIVALLLERGALGAQASAHVAQLFGLLSLSTPAVVIITHAQKMLYARQQAWLPTIVSLGGCLALTVAALWAARWGADGLASLYTILGWSCALALLAALYGRAGFADVRAWLPFAFELTALGVVSGWAGAAAGALLGQATEVPRVGSGLEVSGGFCASIAVFFLGSLILRVPEATACGHFLRWQSGVLSRWMSGVVRSA